MYVIRLSWKSGQICGRSRYGSIPGNGQRMRSPEHLQYTGQRVPAHSYARSPGITLRCRRAPGLLSGMKRLPLVAALAVLVALASAAPAAERLELSDRLVYLSTNLLVDANVSRLEEVFRRAARAGYTGVLLADSKFSRLADMDRRYFQNVER